jgi:hypothetical protein
MEGADNGTNNREGFCCKTCDGVKKHMAQLYIRHPTRGSHVGIRCTERRETIVCIEERGGLGPMCKVRITEPMTKKNVVVAM